MEGPSVSRVGANKNDSFRPGRRIRKHGENLMRKRASIRIRLNAAFGWAAILLIGGALSLTNQSLGDDPKTKEKEPAKNEPKEKEPVKNILKGKEAEDLVQLKREVDALETLYHLAPSEHQLTGL